MVVVGVAKRSARWLQRVFSMIEARRLEFWVARAEGALAALEHRRRHIDDRATALILRRAELRAEMERLPDNVIALPVRKGRPVLVRSMGRAVR